jgi:transcriptional regulator with XRE-family HTH domain
MMQGSLAEKLRVLRARRGLSLTEAAGRAGITRDTLSDLEHGKRHPYMPTLSKIAAGYGVPVEELLEEPALAGKAEAPTPGPSRSHEEDSELTSQEWARIQGARLHGMNAEEWDEHVRAHDTPEGVAETWKKIHDESRMLHGMYSAHKWQHPEDRAKRQNLARGLKSVRMRRYGDLQAVAMLLRAEALVNEIFAEMEKESIENA